MKDIAALTKAYDKDVALWTGYYIEDLSKEQLDALRDVDYVIDGPFIEELKDLSLLWRGSSNQRIWERMPLGFWLDVTESFDKLS